MSTVTKRAPVTARSAWKPADFPTPEAFSAQLDLIGERYRFVTIEEFVETHATQSGMALITFDERGTGPGGGAEAVRVVDAVLAEHRGTR